MTQLRQIKLSDIAFVNPRTEIRHLDEQAEVSFIPMSDVSDSARWITKQNRPLKQVRNGYTNFQEGDVLFAKITPCMENGKGCLLSGLKHGVGFGSTEFHVLRAKENADPRYIFQWSVFGELRTKAATGMTGSAGQQRVAAEFFDRFLIPSISKAEQSKIAEVLSSVDRAVEQTESLIAKYHRIKTGLMRDLLTRGIDEHSRLRDPATHKFKPSPVGLIPEEWHVSPLETKKRRDRPYIKTGPFGSSLKIRDWVEEGIPVITIGALGQGEIVKSELLFVSEAKARSLAAYTVEPGDLLFSRVADVGRSMVINVSEAGWIMSSNLMRISLDQSLVVPTFAYLSLLDERTTQQTRRSVNASGREVANTAILKALQFAWPSLGEQSRIVSHVTTQDYCIRAEQDHLDKLRRVKTGLMQDLLTGKVSVEPLLVEGG